MIHRGTRYPRGLHRGDRKQHILVKGGRVIYMSPEAHKAVLEMWLRANVVTTTVIEEDSVGNWFELEITLPDTFDGSPEDGWTGPLVAGAPDVTLGLFWSDNLTAWTDGGWIAAPGKSTEDLGDGRKKWFVRYEAMPLIYKSALIDLRLTSARHGKSITALSLLGSTVSLPGYPYAMPSQAATLQTDLRAAGLTGAAVTSSTGTWSADIRNNDVGTDHGGNPLYFDATWSGDDITALTERRTGDAVSLPNFPYTMPTDEAALEADLLAEGYLYPQVTLSKDEWEIFLPDISTTGLERRFEATITPADPMQLWTFFGTANGINPQTQLTAAIENVRISGAGVDEANKASFARVGFVG